MRINDSPEPIKVLEEKHENEATLYYESPGLRDYDNSPLKERSLGSKVNTPKRKKYSQDLKEVLETE